MTNLLEYSLQTPDKLWHTENASGPTAAINQLVAKLYPGATAVKLTHAELNALSDNIRQTSIISVALKVGQTDKYKLYNKHYSPVYYYLLTINTNQTKGRE